MPNDKVSARRDLDDEEMTNILERCYRLLQGRRESSTSSTAGVATVSTPIAATLGRHLRRQIFDTVKTRLTKHDHNFYDVIWPTVKKLPREHPPFIAALEHDFPFGITAPDNCSYPVFNEFIYPLIKEMNSLDDAAQLSQPASVVFQTNLDDEDYLDLDLDSSGRWMVGGSIEISRNVDGFNFPSCLSVGDLERVERLLTTQLMKRAVEADWGGVGDGDCGGLYYALEEVLDESSEVRQSLEESGLMIPLWTLPDSDRLHGPNWPYGRGVFVGEEGKMAAWINVLDHLRVLTSFAKPGSTFGEAYYRVIDFVRHLSTSISFSWSNEVGFISPRPSSVGHGMILRVRVRLSQLAKEPENLQRLCSVRGLSLRKCVSDAPVFELGSRQTLGINERQSLEDFATAVSNVLQLEKDMAMHNSLHIAQLLVSVFRRRRSGLLSLAADRR